MKSTHSLRGDRDIEEDGMSCSDFTNEEREGVYKAIYKRRDIRHFNGEPVSDEKLFRILKAAHHAPSVGFMQPWNFIIIRSEETRNRLKQVVDKERKAMEIHFEGSRKSKFAKLKVEGITDAPITVCITCDPTRGGDHVLGRNSIPETDIYSTSCAVQNLWLAARAEGLGVGWVTFFKKNDIRRALQLPPHVDPLGLLCIGYTDRFPEKPLLEKAGWEKRKEFQRTLFDEQWGQPSTLIDSSINRKSKGE
jgi:5,6-dimethylbenzimidazole synthase